MLPREITINAEHKHRREETGFLGIKGGFKKRKHPVEKSRCLRHKDGENEFIMNAELSPVIWGLLFLSGSRKV